MRFNYDPHLPLTSKSLRRLAWACFALISSVLADFNPSARIVEALFSVPTPIESRGVNNGND
jgi:hypothetical protein